MIHNDDGITIEDIVKYKQLKESIMDIAREMNLTVVITPAWEPRLFEFAMKVRELTL